MPSDSHCGISVSISIIFCSARYKTGFTLFCSATDFTAKTGDGFVFPDPGARVEEDGGDAHHHDEPHQHANIDRVLLLEPTQGLERVHHAAVPVRANAGQE